MSFELFTSKSARSGVEPRISISLRGTFHLNSACMHMHFKEVGYVQLLCDIHSRKIAIKPASAKDEHTYKLSRGKQGGGHVSGQGFLKHYRIPHEKTRSYPAEWIEDPGAVVIAIGDK